jgi:hypothetical protein
MDDINVLHSLPLYCNHTSHAHRQITIMGRDEPDPECIIEGKRKHVQTERAAAAGSTANEHRSNRKKIARTTFTPCNGSGTTSSPPTPTPILPLISTPPSAPTNTTTHGHTSTTIVSRDLGPSGKEIAPTAPEKTDQKANYNHRKGFTCYGRPDQSCAADHSRWKGSKSLAYTFLTYKDCQYDEQGRLIACHHYCAWCGEKSEGWTWSLKGDSSTGNYMKHFQRLHLAKWTAAQNADNAVLAPTPPGTLPGPTVKGMFAAQVCFMLAYTSLVAQTVPFQGI